MSKYTKIQIERHIRTHSQSAVHDSDAVATLKYFLRSNGKINTDFRDNDKWPNIDGGFELVSDPAVSRRPNQRFIAQIKGTTINNFDSEGNLVYQLQNLAFPAYVLNEVTFDPCILFIVLNPSKRGQERVFWKYISFEFLSKINFENDSATIKFSNREELYNDDNSIDDFAAELTDTVSHHFFTKKLTLTEHTKEGVIRIINECNKQICEDLMRFDSTEDSRDVISKRLLNRLEDICIGSLLLNAINLGYNNPNQRLAWELSQMDIATKFLGSFLQSLRYIDRRIPEENQSERLMLKYYDFLWKIRELLKQNYNLEILANLEEFPLDLDTEDEDYYTIVAETIDKVKTKESIKKSRRYYIHKKKAFYSGSKRYFEITLQLASIYSTKFNRLTIYTKEDISTNYSIEIGYSEAEIMLWEDKSSKIKVVTNWRVSIEPAVLNKLAGIFKNELKISSNYGEYESLMKALTRTGINFLDLIDLSQETFDWFINEVYQNVKTSYFKEILLFSKAKFSENANFIKGRNVIRYVLINLRESMLDGIKPTQFDNKKFPNNDIAITSKCCPFDERPYMYNLPNSKTNGKTVSSDIVRAVGLKNIGQMLPYLILKNKTESTGEIYILKEEMDCEQIANYNSIISSWDKNNGNSIKEYGDKIYIDSYENNLLDILYNLNEYTKCGNIGQEQLNKKFINENSEVVTDDIKKAAINKVFVNSKILMIYGPAGTGKTTLMDYISTLMKGSSKLFLAKTHTAVENLKKIIKVPGQAAFMGIDKFVNAKNLDYDIVFIDECSTIDNRKMQEALAKINPNSLLVLAGDIYQIESIGFGNWFHYAKEILEEKSIVELNNNWRTDEETLLNLWNEVRHRQPLITEKLVIDGPFSENLNGRMFDITSEDEIVLCLNYDGRFGLNNINNYFQETNTGKAFAWQEWIYKIGDRILFNDSKRFPMLYNNLKGRIVDVFLEDGSITFEIDVFTNLTGISARNSDLEFVSFEDNSTRIRFTVFEKSGGVTEEERENSRMQSVVPFQLAYAVSIHKSQGLEFDSVKIVIPDTNEESITHGIFYTAVTRAKKKLKIFWSAEVMKKVITRFNEESHTQISLPIIKTKFKEMVEMQK